MKELERVIGYEFTDKRLMELALTHSSFANEHRGDAGCNERLEYLGDAVLGMAVAEYIFKNYPEMPEGEMSRMRAQLVCERSLAGIAAKLELGKYLRLGHGEQLGGGSSRASITSDAVEALIAALYLDGGFEASSRFIAEYITSDVQGLLRRGRDSKTVLQEYVQARQGLSMEYALVDSRGPDHRKEFEVSLVLNGEDFARGVGSSKKAAEQAAAEAALERFGV